jgi:hypothetical protein
MKNRTSERENCVAGSHSDDRTCLGFVTGVDFVPFASFERILIGQEIALRLLVVRREIWIGFVSPVAKWWSFPLHFVVQVPRILLSVL